MLKYEFEERVSALINKGALPDWQRDFKISEDDYRKIEHVYNYYPGIDKEAAARLYVEFGLRIFEDMTPRADKIADLENKIHTLRMTIMQYQEDIEKL